MTDQTEQSIQGDDTAPAQGGPDQNAELLIRLKQLEDNNRKLLGELNNSREKLSQKEQQDQQAQLLADGKATELVEQLRNTVSEKEGRIAELERENSEQQQKFVQSQTKNVVLNAFAQAGAHTPDDLYRLEQDNFENRDGNVVAIVGGVETPIQQYIDGLRAPGSAKAYCFSGTGARGMSATGSQSSASQGQDLKSMSYSEQLQMRVEQPELYARLQAQQAG